MSRGNQKRGFDDFEPRNGLDLPEDPLREGEPEDFGLETGFTPSESVREYEGLSEVEEVPRGFAAEAGSAGGETADSAAEASEDSWEDEEGEFEEKKKGGGFAAWFAGLWAALRQTSPYVVMLALSLLALIVATAILVGELWRYNFEFRPPR
jgi:hypothetical protein